MAFDIGVVGLGAIARKQHVPSIAKNGDFRLVAAASLGGAGLATEEGGVPVYGDHRAMLAAHPGIVAVVVCTPPGARLAIAAEVMATGRAVMLEKPPAATPGGLAHLAGVAAAQGVVLHTAWHSQYNEAVDLAREMLRGQRIRRVEMVWKEDVHRWHPGQQWIWEAGGFGVFDAGINGLSILTKILDRPLFAVSAVLHVPVDAAVPVAAQVVMSDGGEGTITGDFDWGWQGGSAGDRDRDAGGAADRVAGVGGADGGGWGGGARWGAWRGAGRVWGDLPGFRGVAGAGAVIGRWGAAGVGGGYLPRRAGGGGAGGAALIWTLRCGTLHHGIKERENGHDDGTRDTGRRVLLVC